MTQAPQHTATQQHALIADYLGLVRSIALHTARTLPSFVDVNDLIQSGTLGLIEAARRFDVKQDVSFPTYAKHRIRGAILDSLRREDVLSRDMRSYQRRIHAASHRLEQEHQREATAQEIAEALGLEAGHLDSIRLRLQQACECSTDDTHEDGRPKADLPDRSENRPDAILERSRLRTQVQRAMALLPERDRLVLHLYYTEELTMKEIGVILGVQESRVSQIHKRATSTMAAHLQSKPASGISHSVRRAAA